MTPSLAGVHASGFLSDATSVAADVGSIQFAWHKSAGDRVKIIETLLTTRGEGGVDEFWDCGGSAYGGCPGHPKLAPPAPTPAPHRLGAGGCASCQQ